MSVKIGRESLLYSEGMRCDTSMLKRKGYFGNYKNIFKEIKQLYNYILGMRGDTSMLK
jgi:hypothetical protein